VSSGPDFANRKWLQLAKRERPDWLRQLGMAMLVGGLLGVLGPFGSYPAFSAGVRYGFWGVMAITGLLSLWGAEALLGSRLNQTPWARTAALAAASAVPMTFFVAWVFSLLQPGRVFPPGRLLVLYLCVALVQLILAAVVMRTRAKEQTAESASRLPRELGGDVIALEAEDHYLRVHRSSGSTLVLMRLADAVAADDGQQGLQVHRSWWVNREAVQRLEGSQLHLSNGLSVPVGRTFAAQVRAAFRPKP
jgi:hypothetical protein